MSLNNMLFEIAVMKDIKRIPLKKKEKKALNKIYKLNEVKE